MPHHPILVLMFFVGCALMTPSHPTIESAITARLGSREVVIESSCGAFSPETRARVLAPSFRTKHPKGLFVVCDKNVSGDNATATVHRLVYHASLDDVVVSEETRVSLRGERGIWRITEWETTAVDYAPPASSSRSSV
jgi:hypothetical protein